MTTTPRRLAGRCWNGAERDSGHVWHAVEAAALPFGKALCGAEPGRHSNGWCDQAGAAVTCGRCLRRLKNQTQTPRGPTP